MIELVQKEMDKIFEFLKVLHMISQVFRSDKLVNTEVMKAKFLDFIDEITDPDSFQVSRISELSVIDAVIKKESEKLQSRIARLDELTEMHNFWMIQADNIIILNAKELAKLTDAMKAYRGKSIT